MIKSLRWGVTMVVCLISVAWSQGQGAGGVRGRVYDQDFEAPLVGAEVQLFETGDKRETTEEGNYVFGQVPPGTYTLITVKEGYTRQVKGDVVVTAGGMTEVDVWLPGEYTEMEEFIVQDLDLGGGSEIGLLNLRMDAPALMSGISADMMSQAGASDAAGALKLVAGATVQDGKYAVVRGLPDRYVNSQLNGVRLPTSDTDKRAVQLDQFPAAMIESIQVSKTFTPDQQGDASGGAVNVVLKGVPDERVLKVSAKTQYNTQTTGKSDFLTYEGGGTSFLGMANGREIPANGQFGGAMGTTRDDAPLYYSSGVTFGGKHDLASGARVGAIGNVYYKHESSFYDNGINDKYKASLSGGRYVLEPALDSGGDYTSLYDVTEGVESVQWGVMGATGIEWGNHALNLMFMRTQVTEDEATLMEDTRGSEYYASNSNVDAKFHRSQTLEYTERSQDTLQLNGTHTLEISERSFGEYWTFLSPSIDWTVATSSASMDQPDKRLFSVDWQPAHPTFPNLLPAQYGGFDGGSGFPWAQRIWKEIKEDSNQYFVNGKLPFTQWTGDEGYFKVGLFNDQTDREYTQNSFDYEKGSTYNADWSQFWSDVYVSEGHAITPSNEDVGYTGKQDISAWYYMVDMPVNSLVKFVGGARHESTDLSVTNHPESATAKYLPPGGTGWTVFGPNADVAFSQDDVLPSLGVEVKPWDKVKLRGSYSETVARQTFKELSPVMQMEFLGSDIFVGNPNLTMSAVENYDLRLDYEPYEGSLLSVGWFHKDVKNPIEYVQRFQASLFYTTAINYPEGWLDGYEFELRQNLGRFWESMSGFTVGANATLIDSQVSLPADEIADFSAVQAPTSTRNMMNAPEHLFNFNVAYESEEYGSKVGLFYTVRGDTLVEGAAALSNGYLPDVYETQFETLNFSFQQPIGERFNLTFQAKNLINPKIQRVYRSDYVAGDTVKTSYTRGIDFSLSLAYSF